MSIVYSNSSQGVYYYNNINDLDIRQVTAVCRISGRSRAPSPDSQPSASFVTRRRHYAILRVVRGSSTCHSASDRPAMRLGKDGRTSYAYRLFYSCLICSVDAILGPGIMWSACVACVHLSVFGYLVRSRGTQLPAKMFPINSISLILTRSRVS